VNRTYTVTVQRSIIVLLWYTARRTDVIVLAGAGGKVWSVGDDVTRVGDRSRQIEAPVMAESEAILHFCGQLISN